MRTFRFLVTDDDDDKRALIRIALKKTFRSSLVIECVSGKEALEYLAAHPVDLLVTNHDMRPVDGIELVSTIRRMSSKLPIIMVSGHTDLRPRALEVGVDVFIDSKQLLTLGETVVALLRGKGLLPPSAQSQSAPV